MNTKIISALLISSGNIAIHQITNAGGEFIHHLPTIKINANATSNNAFGAAFTSSQGTISKEQIETRPLSRPAEVLETIPGVIVTQHSGTGKANQFFLRGFNLDHGTDFATSFDEQPINMVSHAHGQGYTDLNFLISEIIDSIQYHKGATSIEDGDFASAGTAKISTIHALERPYVQVTLGKNDLMRFLGVGNFILESGEVIGAIENLNNDGPWKNPENFSKQNLFLKYYTGNHNKNQSLGFQHYQAKWDATDQIPQRLINNGELDRFDSLNTSDGGKSSRTAIWFNSKYNEGSQYTELSSYAIYNKLNLFSDFSYFLNDPIRGDQFEQAEERTTIGAKYQKSWLTNWYQKEQLNSLGSSIRYDNINDLGLYQTQNRQRFNTIREDDIHQLSIAIWAQNQTSWQPWLRTILGLRTDYYSFDVNSDRKENSGQKNDHIFSPKFSLILGPWKNIEYYLNYAYGFHSNDARGTTTKLNVDPRDSQYLQPLDPVSPLVKTINSEIGLRTNIIPELTSTLALWRLDSDSELIFIGDAGTTESSRPSKRQGIEISQFYQPTDAWIIDIDAAWSKARFKNDSPEGNHIPGAIEKTLAAGFTYKLSDKLNFGGRLRYFGTRPLIEDNSVRSKSSTLVNLQSSYQFNKNLQGQLEIFDVFDRKINDIEYYYASCASQDLNSAACSPSSSEREGIFDKHVHPSEGRNLRLTLRYLF
ncbi:TonB-dependent receptor [Acinetobacter sp. 2JN-4]|uniref:TonB-dependent receptor n=1 Tax=Acinetobacter sp. 2JN-4 TaxID=2479844 RepID=UPI000EF9BD0B|nr:TonB-dependent receptor [Acinetobacter sp. 2JN-4]RLZ07237.1 TonB-dependent receptor [Acinetobacter sp. 2JN-4]